jgi:phosphatidate cytidylyltransferase
MTRVLSALVLLSTVVGVVGWLPAVATTGLATCVALAAFVEYRAIAESLDARVPAIVTALGVAAVCATLGWPGARVEAVLMIATVTVGVTVLGSSASGGHILRDASMSLFAVLYLGLPLGALAALRAETGPAAVLLLLATVAISDTTQYYGGRLMGRRALAPTISPKKTVEGAVVGVVIGTVAMAALGSWGLPAFPTSVLVLLGATVTTLGIAGDLFESGLKRGAGVKDASSLIPGHGGMLDRIDGLLFAAPMFYVVVRSWR